MFRYLVAPALLAGLVATPALAQSQRPSFAGPRVEAVAGTSDDIFVGGGLGYDFQSGKFVFGVEGEATTSLQSNCEILNTNVQDRICTKLGRDLYAGGRIGFALGRGTLLYGKAGYTNLRIKDKYDPGTSGGTGFEFTQNFDGIRVGAGIEQKLGRAAYVKGEYRYSNYEGNNWKHDGAIGIGLRF